jgi:phenylpyruvate tautomerase PptA (4-oxalocrotonate tautomerase family)
MPFIRITSFPWEKEKRSRVAAEITEVVVKHNPGLPREAVWIAFEPMPQESWAVGGTVVPDTKK